MIRVTADFSDVVKTMDRIQRKQIPFSISRAINDVAFQATKVLKTDAPSYLDRPTPFTLRGFKVLKSTKKNLVGFVYIDTIQSRYLKFQIEGGVRKDTKSKNSTGRVIVPVNIKLNAFGNIPGKATGVAKGKKKFIATRKGITGVWVRTGGKRNPRVHLAAYYNKTAVYKKIFPFHKIVQVHVQHHIGKLFQKHLEQALRTQR